MAFQAGEVIDERARQILQDTVPATERWGDPLLFAFLNDAILLIITHKPESTLTGPYTATIPTLPIVSFLTDVVPLADKYLTALPDYVASLAFACDGRDRQDMDRATHHATQFLIKAGLPLSLLTAGRDQFVDENQR